MAKETAILSGWLNIIFTYHLFIEPFLGYRDNEIGPLALFLSLYAKKDTK